MNAQQMREILIEALKRLEEIGECEVEWHRIDSYGERGLLTSDEGVVVTATDGSEFQITIVQVA